MIHITYLYIYNIFINRAESATGYSSQPIGEPRSCISRHSTPRGRSRAKSPGSPREKADEEGLVGDLDTWQQSEPLWTTSAMTSTEVFVIGQNWPF